VGSLKRRRSRTTRLTKVTWSSHGSSNRTKTKRDHSLQILILQTTSTWTAYPPGRRAGPSQTSGSVLPRSHAGNATNSMHWTSTHPSIKMAPRDSVQASVLTNSMPSTPRSAHSPPAVPPLSRIRVHSSTGGGSAPNSMDWTTLIK